MAITPKPPINTPVKDKAIEDKADAAHENKAEAKVEEAKADRPTGYAAVGGNMIVTAVFEDDKNTPNGTMLYPITENTGPALPGYSWSGEKYYPPAP